MPNYVVFDQLILKHPISAVYLISKIPLALIELFE